MLHIFLSNREGAVRPGTTGVAVPGYDLRIVDEAGHDVAPGTPGHAARARRRRRRPATGRATTPRGRCSRASGCAPATPTSRTPTGTTPASAAPATCSRPAASGCRPAEVEGRLLAHDAVAQAVVVAAPDADGLEKPVAYVVLHAGRQRHRGRADRVLPRRPAVVQAAAPRRVRRRVPDHRDRQDPPGRAARGRGRRAVETAPVSGVT